MKNKILLLVFITILIFVSFLINYWSQISQAISNQAVLLSPKSNQMYAENYLLYLHNLCRDYYVRHSSLGHKYPESFEEIKELDQKSQQWNPRSPFDEMMKNRGQYQFNYHVIDQEKFYISAHAKKRKWPSYCITQEGDLREDAQGKNIAYYDSCKELDYAKFSAFPVAKKLEQILNKQSEWTIKEKNQGAHNSFTYRFKRADEKLYFLSIYFKGLRSLDEARAELQRSEMRVSVGPRVGEQALVADEGVVYGQDPAKSCTILAREENYFIQINAASEPLAREFLSHVVRAIH